MQNTSSDRMEDAMSEDTMMDCGVDTESIDTLGDLVNDIPDNTSAIRDAAERLLTLLGVDELDDDFFSSSEDEGVDLDDNEDDDDDDDDDDIPNTRLLHQLAVTLVEELKYEQLQNNNVNEKNNLREIIVNDDNEKIQRMDITYSSNDMNETVHKQSSILGNKFGVNCYNNCQCEENIDEKNEIRYRLLDNQLIKSRDCDEFFIKNKPFRIDDCRHIIDEEKNKIIDNCNVKSLWTAGWDSCATEAVRYLIDVEGFDPVHPTILALKKHLDIQRNHSIIQSTT